MATLSHVLLACLPLAGSALAGVPGKAGLDQYNDLWENSPFCSKPVEKPRPAGELVNWMLGGVSEVEGGYLVMLSHRHRAGERLVIRPSGIDHFLADRFEPLTPGAYQIERVEFAADWRDLEVHLVAGGERGTLRFDKTSMVPAMTPAVRLPVKSIPRIPSIPARK